MDLNKFKKDIKSRKSDLYNFIKEYYALCEKYGYFFSATVISEFTLHNFLEKNGKKIYAGTKEHINCKDYGLLQEIINEFAETQK